MGRQLAGCPHTKGILRVNFARDTASALTAAYPDSPTPQGFPERCTPVHEGHTAMLLGAEKRPKPKRIELLDRIRPLHEAKVSHRSIWSAVPRTTGGRHSSSGSSCASGPANFGPSNRPLWASAPTRCRLVWSDWKTRRSSSAASTSSMNAILIRLTPSPPVCFRLRRSLP